MFNAERRRGGEINYSGWFLGSEQGERSKQSFLIQTIKGHACFCLLRDFCRRRKSEFVKAHF